MIEKIDPPIPMTAAEVAEKIKSMPMGSAEDDVGIRSAVLQFSFGLDGVRLIGVENRQIKNCYDWAKEQQE